MAAAVSVRSSSAVAASTPRVFLSMNAKTLAPFAAAVPAIRGASPPNMSASPRRITSSSLTGERTSFALATPGWAAAARSLHSFEPPTHPSPSMPPGVPHMAGASPGKNAALYQPCTSVKSIFTSTKSTPPSASSRQSRVE